MIKVYWDKPQELPIYIHNNTSNVELSLNQILPIITYVVNVFVFIKNCLLVFCVPYGLTCESHLLTLINLERNILSSLYSLEKKASNYAELAEVTINFSFNNRQLAKGGSYSYKVEVCCGNISLELILG